ncbi:hypothetical protein PV350_26750 [Streptomyces sp. PA03-6a]|nr:hypothetical protein [Streptomyces sp. PA03-6a]
MVCGSAPARTQRHRPNLTGTGPAVFLAVGALLTVLLTVYLARAGVRRYWLCAALAPVGAAVFHLAELFVLDALL